MKVLHVNKINLSKENGSFKKEYLGNIVYDNEDVFYFDCNGEVKKRIPIQLVQFIIDLKEDVYKRIDIVNNKSWKYI